MHDINNYFWQHNSTTHRQTRKAHVLCIIYTKPHVFDMFSLQGKVTDSESIHNFKEWLHTECYQILINLPDLKIGKTMVRWCIVNEAETYHWYLWTRMSDAKNLIIPTMLNCPVTTPNAGHTMDTIMHYIDIIMALL